MDAGRILRAFVGAGVLLIAWEEDSRRGVLWQWGRCHCCGEGCIDLTERSMLFVLAEHLAVGDVDRIWALSSSILCDPIRNIPSEFYLIRLATKMIWLPQSTSPGDLFNFRSRATAVDHACESESTSSKEMDPSMAVTLLPTNSNTLE